MNESRRPMVRLTDYIACFGEFRPTDRVCRHHCAINIRCAIDTDQKSRLQFLDEFLEEEDMLMNTH